LGKWGDDVKIIKKEGEVRAYIKAK